MTEFSQKLCKTIEEARRIHSREREVVSESILIIRTLAWMRAEHFIAGKHEALAKKIGLTPDQYFKRLRVAKLSWYFPKVLDYLKEGKICLSHAALLLPKMTQANEQVIWDNILGKGRREVEDFLRRVQGDGTVKPKSDEMITLTLTVTTDQEAMIHRLTEVLSARGQAPSTTEAILTAVDKLLSQRDQLRRAAKMADKDAARERTLRDEGTGAGEDFTVVRQSDEDGALSTRDLLPCGSGPKGLETPRRRPLPAMVRRAVYRQSRGVCQHRMPDGGLCGATRMLEIDHLVPLARGGRDDLSNLTLVCREHNHHRARQILGAETMDRYRPLGKIS